MFSTTTLVSVMLPVLVTYPVKLSRPPGTTGLAGQNFATMMDGAVATGQTAVALSETLLPQRLIAVAVRVSTHGPQESGGTT